MARNIPLIISVSNSNQKRVFQSEIVMAIRSFENN